MNSYLLLKLIHILAVVLFLGNIFTGLFWMHQAHRTKNLLIINHTMKKIILSDKYFTLPGVLIIVAGGFGAAIYNSMPLLRTGWILWSIILFTISGLIYGAKLARLQKKIYQFTIVKENEPGFSWAVYEKLFKEWDRWGLAALITPIIALMMMVLKWPA